jgi:hypothetical protein
MILRLVFFTLSVLANVVLESTLRSSFMFPAKDAARVTSGIHAGATAVCALVGLTTKFASTNLLLDAIQIASMGYWVNDYYHMWRFRLLYSSTEIVQYLFHHTIALYAFPYHRSFSYEFFRIYISEVSTVFLNLQGLVKDRRSIRCNAIKICFVLSFFVVRICNFTHLLTDTTSVRRVWEVSGCGLIAFVGLLMLNYYWFFRVCLSIQHHGVFAVK